MKLTAKNVAIILFVLFILFWIPFTRMAILFILPLGSGVDDLAFILFGIGAGIAYAFHRAGLARGLDRTRLVFLLIVGLAFLSLVVAILSGGF